VIRSLKLTEQLLGNCCRDSAMHSALIMIISIESGIRLLAFLCEEDNSIGATKAPIAVTSALLLT